MVRGDLEVIFVWIFRNSNHGNLVTILVGNKCDLVSKREVSED